MQRTLWILLCGIIVSLLVAGCPREKQTNVVTPPGKTEDNKANDIDINVNTDDKTSDSSTDTDATSSTTPPADGSTPADSTTPPADAADAPPPMSGTSVVVLETTKGNIELEIHPEWAPLGAARFLECVGSGFYNGAPFFRVIDGFMAQTGLAADPKLNQEWSGKKIADDKPVPSISNTEGMLSFAMAGPNTRTTQFFINFGNNSQLDPQGFTPFAKVSSGMDVVGKIFRTGENSSNEQGLMQTEGGLDQVKKLHPEMDFINKAYVKK